MKNETKKKIGAVAIGSILVISAFGAPGIYAQRKSIDYTGKWVTGDFHTHTFLTDGSEKEEEVVKNAFSKYGLDWMANSEHGGTSKNDPFGNAFPSPVSRWITLSYYSYPIISALREEYSNKKLIQGVEWNVPSHEHASVGIISTGPAAISNFEYIFDASDKDTSRSNEGITKNNTTHEDAVEGAKWLEDNYKDSSYFILNHPSRKLKYLVTDIRDFNDAAPNVAFGFEGIPGHQKESSRGGYESSDNKAKTYGGVDYMVAKVGGLWDSLLGEGRNFWVFANSDFHNTDGDFWPGEYEKNYTFVTGNDYKSLVSGFRSGNSFAVEGDLINGLEFSVQKNKKKAVMGENLKVSKGDNIQITIRFKSPKCNNNGDKVNVDHIDLIAGDVTGKASPGTYGYSKDTNETTKVIARFSAKNWKKDDSGWITIKYNVNNIDNSKYFRLRGTNLGVGVANETDAEGNPLCDELVGANNANKAYADLWFYSNPVFVSVK
ncbi:CehA/McbA family metallohydrolase domain-containing protein [Acetivibrio cellulolyticus]|uniref:hypothetical protein n=1 Tax=Acetivibrio cellulolyticus TaxID=35830 RepID=UPI0001E2D8F2|nr:hypothetical protein [Acetivibrio cellulolyticus]